MGALEIVISRESRHEMLAALSPKQLVVVALADIAQAFLVNLLVVVPLLLPLM